MKNKLLHIISFNIPYPPNYGGVIDVYYKLSTLKDLGYEVILHTFLYDRQANSKLEDICSKVYYYEREIGLMSFLNFKPYIVNSRRSSELLNNLNAHNGTIIFEGLHSCYYLNHNSLVTRNKIVRTHNIEHKYYFHLFKAERNVFKKIFFLCESIKLRFYQNILINASSIAAISKDDSEYFQSINKNTFILYPFHSNSEIISQTGKGTYYLYHGNLKVPENIKAVNFFIDKVFSKIDLKLIIAGKNPDNKLKDQINKRSNIILVENPEPKEMQNLISNAQGIILYTLQATGVKLKLLESLFKGRFCLVNEKMVKGTELDDVCLIANSPAEFISLLKLINNQDFNNENLASRNIFTEKYLTENNVKSLIECL